MRKLATIQKIERLSPITGADRIELAHIKGWQVVVGKGLYKEGSWVVYHEIDSFFKEGHEPYHSDLQARGTKLCELETGEIVKGYVIKTIKLRGEISQGYCVPITCFEETIQKEINKHLEVDYDVTQLLGVYKYEKPETTGEKQESIEKTPVGRLAITRWKLRKWLQYKYPKVFKKVKIKTNFPSFLSKSECVRVQNCKTYIWDAYQNNAEFQVSVKLDGSSITTFRHGRDVGVCSRNLRKNPKNETDAFIKNGQVIHNKIAIDGYNKDYVFQGELLDTNIQKNFEGVSHAQVKVYSMWSISKQEYINPETVLDVCKILDIEHVPVLHPKITLRKLFPSATDADELLKLMLNYADGPSSLNGKYREGLVYKELKNGYTSVKTISNKYLLKEQD